MFTDQGRRGWFLAKRVISDRKSRKAAKGRFAAFADFTAVYQKPVAKTWSEKSKMYQKRVTGLRGTGTGQVSLERVLAKECQKNRCKSVKKHCFV